MEAKLLEGTDARPAQFDTATIRFTTEGKNAKIMKLIDVNEQHSTGWRKRLTQRTQLVSSASARHHGSSFASQASFRYERAGAPEVHFFINSKTQEAHSSTFIWTTYSQYETFFSSGNEVIETYKNENVLSNLHINSWFVKEVHNGHDSVSSFASMVDLGAILMADSRSTNEIESRSIDAFFQKKGRLIPF